MSTEESVSSVVESSTTVEAPVAPSYQPPKDDKTARPEMQADKAEVTDKGDAQTEKKEVSAKKSIPDAIKKEGKSDWVQSRITHYASEAKQLREQLQQMQRELEQVKSGGNKGQQRDPTAQPRQEDYENYSEFVDALVDWKVGQREASMKTQQTQQTYQQDFARRYSEFDKNLRTFASGYDQPEAVINALKSDDLPVTPVMADAIMNLGDKGPEVLWHLAQNPMEAMEIAQLQPAMAAMKIGMLSMKLGTSAPTPQPIAQQPQTPQPKPVPSIRGSSPANDLDATPNDGDDIVKWAQKEAARAMKFNPQARMYIPRG